MGTHRRGTSSLQWSVADLLRREGRLRPGPVGVRGLAVGGALVCTTVVAVSMAGEPENVVTSSEPEALPPAPTGPPSSVDGSDFVDTPPPAGLPPWAALDSQAAASQPASPQPASPQPASPQPASPQPASPQPEPPSVPGTGSTGNAGAEPRTAGAERGRDRARTTARDRPVDRDFPVSGAVERSRGRHAAPPRLPDRGPQIQRDVIVRDKPSDDGREEKRRRYDTTRDGGEVVVDRDAPDDDGKRQAVADEHDPGAGDSDAAARDDTTGDDERDDHTRQDVDPDADVPDQRHDDVDEPDRDDGAEPRDGSDQGGQQRTPDAVLASARDRDEQSDRGGSDGDDGHRSEDRPDEDEADERDRAGSEDHDDDLDESDEADEGQADRSDDDRGSEGRHRASD